MSERSELFFPEEKTYPPRKPAPTPWPAPAPPAPSAEEKLLTEIRDLLKKP